MRICSILTPLKIKHTVSNKVQTFIYENNTIYCNLQLVTVHSACSIVRSYEADIWVVC
jgi:hypothetical protein